MKNEKQSNIADVVRNFFNGIAFGITETIPGVSGSTVAIILGFYNNLLDAVNNFRKNPKKSLRFLIPLGLGLAIGIVLFASLINFLLENFSFPTMLFFIGLIVGIIPLFFQKVRATKSKVNVRDVLLVLVPIIALIVISYIKPDTVMNPSEAIMSITYPYMLFIFFSGILAAAALVVPGVSGSFVLLLLGIYPLATFALSQIGPWLADPSNMELLVNILKVLIPLGIGVVIGALAMMRLIGHLFEKHNRAVYLAILGLLLGSVYALFNEPLVYQSKMSAPVLIAGVATLACGAIASYQLGRKKL